MKRFLLIGLVSVLGFLLTSCEAGERFGKDLSSNFGGGLNRVLTVYSNNGEKLAEYIGKFDIETNSETSGVQKVKFDLKGIRHIIYGGVVIVDEKPEVESN